MDAPEWSSSNAAPEAALLFRIQQDNQREVLGKLLHDLRNPIHSIRISLELFGRLARGSGDKSALMARAAAYIGPAEAALESLLTSNTRLSLYLATPGAANCTPILLDELFAEITLLLRGSRQRRQVRESSEAVRQSSWAVSADRPRLAHGLLHWCLTRGCAAVALSARPAEDRIVLEASCDPEPQLAPDSAPWARPLSREELAMLIEAAGGSLLAAAPERLSMSFRSAAASRSP